MDRQIIVITADERQEKLVSLMHGIKKRCSLEEYQREQARNNGFGERIYVLPIPVTKLEKKDEVVQKLKEELINLKDDVACVMGGVFTKDWKTFFEEQAIFYIDLMELSDVVEGNAWITAEAVIAEVILHSAYSIRGQRVLVTGYGACGSKIAKLFSNIGAKVVVAARREEVRKVASTDGFEAIDFTKLKNRMGEFYTIINTVPAMVITEELIQMLPKDALIIDIASKPGGCDFAAADQCGIKAKLALGLPGIYTTTSSAQILKEAISKYASLQDDVREEQLWIFQIVI